jgi:predicted NUDIX family NTP pyrophosphohydrolase
MMEIKSSHFENTDIDNLGFGAGVLPYAIDEHGEIHVLLGRERFVSSWKGSCTWSGFEGSKKDNETIANTAIREFVEESLGVVLNEQEISTIINDKTFKCYRAFFRIIFVYKYLTVLDGTIAKSI